VGGCGEIGGFGADGFFRSVGHFERDCSETQKKWKKVKEN
jgi:hypothetical protein